MGLFMETTEVNLDTVNFQYLGMEPQQFSAMDSSGDCYNDTIHTIAINTRETEFGSIVEPIPITLKAYKHIQSHGQNTLNGYIYPPQQITTLSPIPRILTLSEVEQPSTSSYIPNAVSVKQEINEESKKYRPPPKKKWIRDYLEEEPKSPVRVRLMSGLAVSAHSNGLVRATSPAPAGPTVPAAPAVVLEPTLPPAALPIAPLLDFVQEHSNSRPRTSNNNSHGLQTIPSSPSANSSASNSSSNGNSSNSNTIGYSNGNTNGNANGNANGNTNGNTPRPGTREVHNKLEKNRRAHLKECFELLKRQLPSTPDDKKTSNLSILHSAIRYIQVLRRKERECEHEMERLAREKIAAQQRLAALKRELTVRATVRPRSIDSIADEKDMERADRVNVQVLGIPITITSPSPQQVNQNAATSPSHSLNLSTKLRTLPIQITPTTSQVVRTSCGARHSTLTLATLPAAEPATHNGQSLENGVTNTINTTLVHPAQIHLPLSQMVSSGGLVVSPAALQLLSTSGGLRVLQAPAVHTNGVTSENRIKRDNGIMTVSPPPATENGNVVVSGLTPLVVSQSAAHLLQSHTLTHKMVDTQSVKGSGAPLTVSAQYLSATTIVKPVVVVSGAHTPPSPPT